MFRVSGWVRQHPAFLLVNPWFDYLIVPRILDGQPAILHPGFENRRYTAQPFSIPAKVLNTPIQRCLNAFDDPRKPLPLLLIHLTWTSL
jgi:hypothetical protein